MSDLRGITSPDLTRIIRSALRSGWEWVGYTGTTHAVIRWPATGQKITFGTTPSVASWKTTATEIEKISGVTVWHKGNRRRSRKAVRPSGYNMYAAADTRLGDLVEELHGELEAYTREFAALAHARARSRTDINRAAWLLRQIRKIEDRLEHYHQPVERFDPVSAA